jgi:hypothetical protein
MNKASLKRLQDIEDTILQLVVQRKKLRLSLSVEFLHHLRVLTKDPELICVYNPNKTLFMGRSDGSLYLEVPRDREHTTLHGFYKLNEDTCHFQMSFIGDAHFFDDPANGILSSPERMTMLLNWTSNREKIYELGGFLHRRFVPDLK